MLKREIAYDDFDGKKQTDVYYFHLSRTELAEMDAKAGGSMTEYLKRIVETKNTKDMFEIIKDIVIRSVGVKSDDGKRFMKDPEFANEFVHSAAFDSLFMELMTDALLAAEFFKALLPADLAKSVEAEMALAAPITEKAE